jgi:uncharacterized protein involved in exopolysaccharide biosynthesis/Mrp family chromosome partitioning ATPase
MQPTPNNRQVRLAERTAPAAPVIPTSDGSSLTISDVYFTLFRHKWKIILCTLLGITGALLFYKTSPRIYISEAKLFIRYVVDSRTPGRGEGDSGVKSPDPGGQAILNSELEIMTSMDLAGKVVDTIGPEKFIEPKNDGRDRDRAVFEFFTSLKASVPPRSSVVQLSFSSPDKTIVQPVLREVINAYLKKHVEIHRTSGMVDDFLTQETDQLRIRLVQTEEELRKAKNKTGFNSLDEAKKVVGDLITKLRSEISVAEADAAEKTAYVQALEISRTKAPTTETGSPSLPTDELINSYSRLAARVDFLQKAEQDLLAQFTPENTRVKKLREQLVEAEATKRKLEEENPSLALLHSPVQSTGTGPRAAPTDFFVESARLKAIQSRIGALREQLERLRTEITNIDQLEATIVDLQRKKDLQEANYRKYSMNLEQARMDEAISSGHVSNISEIQSPSLPLKAKSKRPQIMGVIFISGLCFGLAWAFSIELFFDQTIRRPMEVERKLGLPLLISIPVVDRALRRKLAKLEIPEAKPTGDSTKSPKITSEQKAKEQTVHALQPFHATLRDRLISFFESRNLTHKPKMIAVTGLVKNTGVSTTAAGIAQSLSETGEGNVLLVNMNTGNDATQRFVQGKEVSQLDELLAAKERTAVQENLYVVTEGSNSDRLLRNLPQRFTKLLPKLKASDFDYIIFDMPTVSQVSITPRVAGFMDIVVLVLESELTDRIVVEKASALLAESKAEVGVVLNKTRTYVPPSLHQESLGDL